MKFLWMPIAALMCISASYAREYSPCHEKCFLSKASCNDRKSHTFNSCEPELMACKASCESGKPHEAYRESPALEIALNPVMDVDLF
ncbi:MAG: hypothetical protein HYX35_02265 [Proteobacteria bacterium]|nr:hypothetical protein [Pseudomonadota bacterium]